MRGGGDGTRLLKVEKKKQQQQWSYAVTRWSVCFTGS